MEKEGTVCVGVVRGSSGGKCGVGGEEARNWKG